MSSNGIPAPYGGACENCSKSKTKCVLRPGRACERCHRLNRTCQPLTTVRRCKKKAGRSQIEEKLDEVVSLLRGAGRGDAAAGLNTTRHDHGHSNPSAESFATHPNQSDTSSNSQTPASLLPPPDEHLPAPHEAEATFKLFCSRNLRFFPFVHFPPHTTAATIQSERPFLWLNIMTIMEKNASRQATLGQRVRSILAERVVLGSERSYDLVMGMLAYIGWAMLCAGVKPFLSMYCQIMAAMVNDLGLNQWQPELANPIFRWKQANYAMLTSRLNNTRTLEQRRIILSAWLIIAAAPSFVQRLDPPLRWNTHMDEALQALEDARECHNDSILVALVKTQLIADAAERATAETELAISASPDLIGIGQHTAPPTLLIKMLRSRMQSVVQAMPPEVCSEPIVAGHIHATNLAIYSLALPRSAQSHMTNIPDTERLGLLYSCLETLGSWFTLLQSLSPSEFSVFSLIFTSHLSNFGIMLYRITVLDDPVWDRAEVRRRIDLLQVLDDLAVKVEAIPEELGIVSDTPLGDAYTRAAWMMRSLKVFWGPDVTEPRGGVDERRPGEVADAATRTPGAPGEAGELPAVGLEEMDFEFPPGLMDGFWFSEFVPT